MSGTDVPMAESSEHPDPLTHVHALIRHVDNGIVSLAALRHALTGEPMPDGDNETALIEARLAAHTALARVLAEVAAEVQRQDEAGVVPGVHGWQREALVAYAADAVRSVLAFDQRTGDDR